MLRDPAVRAAFDARVATDPAFAKDPNARLEFFYRRHPSWDAAVGRYAALESQGWKGAQGTALAPGNDQAIFYAGLMRQEAATGRAESGAPGPFREERRKGSARSRIWLRREGVQALQEARRSASEEAAK